MGSDRESTFRLWHRHGWDQRWFHAQVGGDDWVGELHPHQVELAAFWMYEQPITISQYYRFMRETGGEAPVDPNFHGLWTAPGGMGLHCPGRTSCRSARPAGRTLSRIAPGRGPGSRPKPSRSTPPAAPRASPSPGATSGRQVPAAARTRWPGVTSPATTTGENGSTATAVATRPLPPHQALLAYRARRPSGGADAHRPLSSRPKLVRRAGYGRPSARVVQRLVRPRLLPAQPPARSARPRHAAAPPILRHARGRGPVLPTPAAARGGPSTHRKAETRTITDSRASSTPCGLVID